MKSLLTILTIIVLAINICYSQPPITLQIMGTDYKDIPEPFGATNLFQSDFEIHIALKEYISALNEKGYLSASLDSISGDSVLQTAYIFYGSKYEWAHLNTDSVDEEILSRTGFRNKQFLDKPFSVKQVSNFFQDALNYLENTGYPFAEIKLANIEMDSNEISATVVLKKNRFFLIDSVEILGEDTRLSSSYIQNIIGIKAKQPYNEEIVKKISQRISENPFMSESKPYEVIFTENDCKLILLLEPKKSNTFDGIIGVQPQDNEGVIITGDIKFSIGNIVGQGERLKLRWQRIQDETQQIDLSFKIPFLFKTPIGVGYDLNIYRRDTTFNNVHHRLTIPYRISNGTEFHGFIDNFTTSLISVTDYENATDIPPYNDAENQLYGIGFEGQFVQNKLNPYKGWTLSLNGGAGKNKLIKNPALEQINYDSVILESSLLQGDIICSFFQPVTKQTTLLLRGNVATKQTDNLVDNQAYRIGGLLSLRGFDEQSIYASSYVIGTIEYRLLFDKFSRISIFYDWSWYELNSISKFVSDTPYAFGAGITFGTKAGLFSLNYAIGSQFNNPINFRTGKIHFGFVNVF
ncbi:MAG: BamA/TamA family outer membrane protein [Salibacteraceae bacterium]